MPLSEFLRLALEKLESSRKKQCATDSSSRTETELVETSLSYNEPRARDGPIVNTNDPGLTQNDEMVSWLSYPIDNGLQNLMPTRTSFGHGETYLENSRDGFEFLSSKERSLCSWPTQQSQTSDISLESGVSDIISNNTSNNNDAVFGSNNSSFLSFPHFSTSSILVNDKPQNSAETPPSDASGVEKTMEVKQKDSMLVERLNSTEKKNDKAQIGSNIASSTKGLEEMVGGSTSVGSGNSGDRVSCGQTHKSKRKFGDVHESECNNEDIENESIGVEKPTPARGVNGLKRGRTAEVHNLSERRRRDRINDKMRSLQELVPNCNKTDKASMLDDVIEYLKSLKHQVQIMSMGAGIYIPPMMFTNGTQHMYPAHVPHFSHMGTNGGPPRYPIFQVPPIQRAHFPSSPPGTANFLRIPEHGQPRPVPHSSVPRAPSVPLTGQPHSTCPVGSMSLRASSQSEGRPSMPTKSRFENTTKNKKIKDRSNKLEATDTVLNQSAKVQANNQATNVTRSDISEAGRDKQQD